MLPENLLPYKIRASRLTSSPRKSGILPVKWFSFKLSVTRLTKFLMPGGKNPEIRLRPSVRLLSWIERFAMEAGSTPPRSFSIRLSSSSWLQFVKEEMNSQSSASLASRLLFPRETCLRYGRLPRLAGIRPLKLLRLRSICPSDVALANDHGIFPSSRLLAMPRKLRLGRVSPISSGSVPDSWLYAMLNVCREDML
ncbi:hypothetical protein MUK42_30163 [Musa troglodytarum]|uniref:Uncharacterized protein n=1 Tax=Musa troglodytarum TaxID=320322 RepID=A0A9E7K7T4_9LILI|nr:hypothetical protein MUK42_30163 [Musa troglodytarum]